VEPSFDMLGRLRSRRLCWAGHILRSEESNLLRRVLLAQTEQELKAGRSAIGGLLMDVKFETVTLQVYLQLLPGTVLEGCEVDLVAL
jgi:hypothetical protein